MKKDKKPPLGITPQWVLDEHRFEEIIGGICRFSFEHETIPVEWLIELKEIFARAQRRRDENPNASPMLITKNYPNPYD